MPDQWTAESAVVTHALANMPAGMTKLKTPNAKFTTPNAQPWAEISFTNTGTTSQDASGCFAITTGIMNVDIFGTKEQGDKSAKQYAEHFRALFANSWFGALKLQQGNIRPVPDENWYKVIVEFDYTLEGRTDGS